MLTDQTGRTKRSQVHRLDLYASGGLSAMVLIAPCGMRVPFPDESHVCDILPWSSGMKSTLRNWSFLPVLTQVTQLQEVMDD